MNSIRYIHHKFSNSQNDIIPDKSAINNFEPTTSFMLLNWL